MTNTTHNIAAGQTFLVSALDSIDSGWVVTAVWYDDRGMGATHDTPVAGCVPAFRNEMYSGMELSGLVVREGEMVSHGGVTFIAMEVEDDDSCWISLVQCNAEGHPVWPDSYRTLPA